MTKLFSQVISGFESPLQRAVKIRFIEGEYSPFLGSAYDEGACMHFSFNFGDSVVLPKNAGTA